MSRANTLRAWPLLCSATLAITYGGLSAAFAVVAWAYQPLGPAAITQLAIVSALDAIFGSTLVATGFAALARKDWGRIGLREVAPITAAFELGRLVSGQFEFGSFQLLLIGGLAVIRFAADSIGAKSYVGHPDSTMRA